MSIYSLTIGPPEGSCNRWQWVRFPARFAQRALAKSALNKSFHGGRVGEFLATTASEAESPGREVGPGHQDGNGPIFLYTWDSSGTHVTNKLAKT